MDEKSEWKVVVCLERISSSDGAGYFSRAKGSDTDPTPKRRKTSEETRTEHIGEDFSDRLKYKERV